MKVKAVIGCVVVFMMAGCVPSLHELYTDDVIVFEEGLIGKWSMDKTVFEFARAKTGKDQKPYYAMNITDDDGRLAKLDGRMVKLGEMIFLDMYPAGELKDVSDWYKIHMLGVHTFARVEAEKGKFGLRFMNMEKVGKLLKEKPDVVKHEVLKDGIVLTAGPKELQAFLVEYADHDEIYGDVGELEPYADPNEVSAEKK